MIRWLRLLQTFLLSLFRKKILLTNTSILSFRVRHNEADMKDINHAGFRTIAESLDKPEGEVAAILETMANKGLCNAGTFDNVTFYGAPLLVPGIFEFQFMRGTNTEEDRRLAKLVHDYKNAVDNIQGPPRLTYPTTRVIPVDKKIEAGNTIHTYDQVTEFIAKYDPISVSTC